MAGSNNALVIGGVHVEFPAKPYPSQLAMMAQIMKGLRNKQNCLLESPTGSGKTLALLCSTLAWQASYTSKINQYNSLIEQGITDQGILQRVLGDEVPRQEPQPAYEPSLSDDNLPGGFLRGGPTENIDDSLQDMTYYNDQGLMDDDFQRIRKKKVPKIYFGSRTHKQIRQIIKELQRTKYKNVKSLVLGSRDHTCIHPVVSRSDKKNEECRKLREDRTGMEGCTFNYRVSKIKTYDDLKNHGGASVFDLEDLVKIGRKVKACPYYVSRNLMEEAQIIFCPYNYLIDPILRDTMSIDLKGHVLVLDEAHNIEDCARDAASLTFTHTTVLEAKDELEKLKSHKVKIEECTIMASLLSSVSMWIESQHRQLQENAKDYDQSSLIFNGPDAIEKLELIGLGKDNIPSYKKTFQTLIEVENPDDDRPKASAALIQFFERLLITLGFFYKNENSMNDYKMVLKRVQVYGVRKSTQLNGWIDPRKSSTKEEISINLWCLNPGVSFSDIGIQTRSVVLTSGTLSPMTSFQSELSVDFPIQLEANHVITKDQVWVGTLAHGPTMKSLMANFKNTERYDFQDELGKLLLEVCLAVPRGVLCFLPSYSMLDKMTDRWSKTGLLEILSKTKLIITEPKKGIHLDAAMAEFYDALEYSRTTDEGVDGALFLAVCRGKVSEGLDFSDDNARAVIAVGIPFPNVKDLQVNLKKEYNDSYCRANNLLTGSQWYEIQAYRALNQALGRCIRHRNDWGALILVDERYQGSTGNQNRYTKGLSKWVRNMVKHYDFQSAIRELRNFSQNMTANPPSTRMTHIKSILNESLETNDVTKPVLPSPKRWKEDIVEPALYNKNRRYAELPMPGRSCDSDDDMFADHDIVEFPKAKLSPILGTPKYSKRKSHVIPEPTFGDSDIEDFNLSTPSVKKRISTRKKMDVEFMDYDC